MNKKWVLLGTFFILAFTATISLVCYKDYTQSQKPVQSAANAPQTPLDANKILELVNIERAKVGVAPLVMDTGLVATAQSRADDMVKRGYFSHRDPVTNENMVNILNGQKQCVYASENIVWMKYPNTLEDNQESVDWWMDSPAHKEAMLSPKYTLTGIGIKDKSVVQHFCQV